MIYTVKWRKDGAVFADAAAAQADKISHMTAEMYTAMESVYATMVEDGTLLEPVSYQWDQTTFTQSSIKHIVSMEAYLQAWPWTGSEISDAIEAAGWVLVESTVT